MNIDASSSLSGASLATLRRDATASPKDEATLRKVAQQFEALLTQQVLKGARNNAPGDDLMGGSGLDLYKDMFDQQMAQQISSKGLGLADVLVRQLSGSPIEAGSIGPSAPRAAAVASSFVRPLPPITGAAAPAPAAKTVETAAGGSLTDRVASFVRNIWQQAETAAKALGLPTEAVVGHAALETGWGAHQPADGSNNLFGIKADARWRGDKVTAATTEMDGGRTRTEQAAFRAYDSRAEGFADYVRFLKGNARYAEAIKPGSSAQEFAHGLQKAGYATDPHYAAKLTAAVARVAKAVAAGGSADPKTF